MPARTYRAFCETDWKIIATCLRGDPVLEEDLPALARRLDQAIADKVSGEVLTRIPFGPSVPLRLDVDASLRGMAARLASWEDRVRTAVRLSPSTTTTSRLLAMRDAPALVAASADLLHLHMTTLLGLQSEPMTRWLPMPRATADARIDDTRDGVATVWLDGSHAGLEILWMHWLARAVLQETPPRRELLIGVQCRNKSCGQMTLWRAQPPQHDGDPEYWSECRRCRHLMTRDEYDQWVKMHAAYQRARLRTPVLEG